MPIPFRGVARPLDADGLGEAIGRLDVKSAELWAVLGVETHGCGFLPDRRPLILFERHVFSRETGRRYDTTDPDISSATPGGYRGGAGEYTRLDKALALDHDAALHSASWGIGQVMGFNAEIAGFRDVQTMVAAMCQSESEQLAGMAGEIKHNRLDRALRTHDWPAFARGYNGIDYARNSYDTRLAAAYQKYSLGSLPDLVIRSAQIYLTYLGYQLGPADGVMGRFTRAALNSFQAENGLPLQDDISDTLLDRLKEKVGTLPA